MYVWFILDQEKEEIARSYDACWYFQSIYIKSFQKKKKVFFH